MFLLLLQIQSQTDKETIPLIISHLELLTENVNKYVLSSNQIHEIYSVCKKNENWLNYSAIELWILSSMTCHLMCFVFQQEKSILCSQ
jgi:hypothetical protein